jgi:hypothetical protein
MRSSGRAVHANTGPYTRRVISLAIDQVEVVDDGLRASVRCDGADHVLSVSANRPLTPAVGDSLLCATLLPAMAAGVEVLAIPEPVSRVLLRNVDELQTIVAAWLPELRRVRVEAEARHPEPVGTARVASFFSGGVDSFSTVLRNLDRIDMLVFVRGFDLPPEKPRLSSMATERIREIATELGRELIEFDVSIRPFSDRFLSWDMYHGAALGVVAHALNGVATEILVPATMAFIDDLNGWGSHPLTDPLWSSDTVRLRHDGAEFQRVEKIRYLSEHEIAMHNLRVCWENPDEAYNCGHCSKCVLTRVGLRCVGASGRCTTLPAGVEPSDLTSVSIRREGHQDMNRAVVESYVEALTNGPERAPELLDALTRMLGEFRRQQAEAYLGTSEAVVGAEPTVQPAGYRLVDTVYRQLGRMPRVRGAVRRIARTMAGGSQREQGTTGRPPR